MRPTNDSSSKMEHDDFGQPAISECESSSNAKVSMNLATFQCGISFGVSDICSCKSCERMSEEKLLPPSEGLNAVVRWK